MAEQKKDQVAKVAATDKKPKESIEEKAAKDAKSTAKSAKAEVKKETKSAKPEVKKETAKPEVKKEVAKPEAKSEATPKPMPAVSEAKPNADKTQSKPSAETKQKASEGKASKPKKFSANKTRLKKKYDKEVIPYLMKTFSYKNINEVPKVVKIVINMGLGEDKDNAKSIQTAQSELTQIAGQKAVLTKAKGSVANFKVRQGMTIGAKVTLRDERMYTFFDKFVSICLPRVRDFRGVSSKSFDGRGNYALGVKEQLIFPEISYDQVDRVRGFDICFITTAKSDEEARELLKAMGMPFKA